MVCLWHGQSKAPRLKVLGSEQDTRKPEITCDREKANQENSGRETWIFSRGDRQTSQAGRDRLPRRLHPR
jgi:hypothetical protein